MVQLLTTNARFGVLLAALMLMLHSALSRLTPRSVLGRLSEGSTLARRDTDPSCSRTNMVVDHDSYAELCEGTTHMEHPCFSHWYGDLKDVEVRPYHEPVDMTQAIKIKDEAMQDFTIASKYTSFLITYLNAGGVQFLYSDYDFSTNCFNITLRRGSDDSYRIWASDDDKKDRDIDTKNVPSTSKVFCNTKWIHIHAKKDADR